MNGDAVQAAPAMAGFDAFRRHNPKSDLFNVQRFHHVEFWTSDATNISKRFQHGLGMPLVAKSDQGTGNALYASYVLRSNQLVFAFTAPYSKKAATATPSTPFQHYSTDAAYSFINSHGLAVRAVGVVVDDARLAYEIAVKHGGKSVLEPLVLEEKADGGSLTVAEVALYGDVVLRFVSGSFTGPFMPMFQNVDATGEETLGIQRLDHAVGNVHKLGEAAQYLMGFTGFHEFAEFVTADVGTRDSGLNSTVFASNNEMVLLPVNEPTFGTPRKSQIQTYLEQNEGPGLQHLALKSDDIFATLRGMRARSSSGGFEFMPRPSDGYYERLPARIGGVLTAQQFLDVKELGILVDRDDQGTLLQIFSKPLGDRPTVFIEIIQRVGCRMVDVPQSAAAVQAELPVQQEQAGGCGGFGKGNFSELFKSIEDYERTLNV
ncbi:MAG: hypothetical protein WDW36_006402 [Sanguina aurantia]